MVATEPVDGLVIGNTSECAYNFAVAIYHCRTDTDTFAVAKVASAAARDIASRWRSIAALVAAVARILGLSHTGHRMVLDRTCCLADLAAARKYSQVCDLSRPVRSGVKSRLLFACQMWLVCVAQRRYVMLRIRNLARRTSSFTHGYGRTEQSGSAH